MKKKTSRAGMIAVGGDLHAELRAVAGLLGMTIRDVVTSASREWLKRRQKEIAAARATLGKG